MNLITQDQITQELAQRGVQFSTLALNLPDTTTEEQWAELGKKLCRCSHVMSWWIADWAAFGDAKFGALKKFAELNGWAEKTIYNAAWLARRIPPSRRRDDLSLGHHEAVASLSARKQTAMLARAHDENIPVGELRKIIRKRTGTLDANLADGPILDLPQNKVDWLVKWLRDRPGEFWTDETRARWREYLGPLVDFYNGL